MGDWPNIRLGAAWHRHVWVTVLRDCNPGVAIVDSCWTVIISSPALWRSMNAFNLLRQERNGVRASQKKALPTMKPVHEREEAKKFKKKF